MTPLSLRQMLSPRFVGACLAIFFWAGLLALLVFGLLELLGVV